jgi:hypothetical protein
MSPPLDHICLGTLSISGHRIYHLWDPRTLIPSFLSRLPIHYILLFLCPAVCLNKCALLLSNPNFSAYHTTSPSCSHVCKWQEQPISGPRVVTLLVSYWLAVSQGQTMGADLLACKFPPSLHKSYAFPQAVLRYLQDSQSREAEKYGHKSHRTQNQE